jgi:hypothetical protein
MFVMDKLEECRKDDNCVLKRCYLHVLSFEFTYKTTK